MARIFNTKIGTSAPFASSQLIRETGADVRSDTGQAEREWEAV